MKRGAAQGGRYEGLLMPVMSGLEAGRNLSKGHPESPVLMVMIDTLPQLEEEAKKAGIKGV
jgi:hypothetical protein